MSISDELRTNIEIQILYAPIVVAWPISSYKRETLLRFGLLLVSSRQVECYTSTLHLVLNSVIQSFAHDPYSVLYSKSRVQTQHPDVAFPPSLSPSCHDVPAAIVIPFFDDGPSIIVVTVSWWRSCCQRHRLDVAFQPSLLSSGGDDLTIAILSWSSWRHVSSLEIAMPLV